MCVHSTDYSTRAQIEKVEREGRCKLLKKQRFTIAPVAQPVEHVLGKDGVTGSIPVGGLA